MPRTKDTLKHLPPRMAFRHGAFYYRAGGKSFHLGTDYALALIGWREREGIFAQARAGKRLTLAQLLDDAALAKSPNLAPSTLRELNRAVVRLKNSFSGFYPEDVKPSHIAQYLESRGADAAANNEIAYFSACWEYGRSQGWIDLANPCVGVKRNKRNRRKRIASPPEILALTTFAPDADIYRRRFALMAKIALTTGIREEDMLHLTMHSIGPGGLYVQPQKTASRTGVALTFARGPEGGEFDRLLNDVMALRRPFGSAYLFPVLRRENRGKPYETKAFVTAWRRHFESLGIVGLTWHDLRRTTINGARRQDGLEAARDIAGHASVTTTEDYLENVESLAVEPMGITALSDRRVVKPAERAIKGLRGRKAA